MWFVCVLQEAERVIEHYKASLQREGEQSTVLLASVEEMRSELQIVTLKLGLTQASRGSVHSL